MEDMADKHGKEAVIPGMEPTGHYWLNLGAYLQEQGMKPVHVNPHHVKKSKELDDNNPNKNDRKDPKTIAGLVNEGRFFVSIYPNRDIRRDQKSVKSSYSDAGRTYKDQKTGLPDGSVFIFRK